MAAPIVLVSSGAPPITNVDGAPPFTVVESNAPPFVLVDSGGMPVTLLNADGTAWSAFLEDEYRGFEVNFLTMRYGIKTAVGAEIVLGEDQNGNPENGFALDFVDEFGISYAIRRV